MRIFMFSSPYQYYADNLIPLAKKYRELGHDVIASYRLSDSGQEFDMITGEKVKYVEKFLAGGERYDLVFLTQTWWYDDLLISKFCKRNKIKYFVLEHATPMMQYTQKDGTKSHLYRAHDSGAKCYFSFGPKNIEVMKKIGYQGVNLAIGSPRIEGMINEAPMEEEEGTVIFDTSERMEDQNTINIVENYIRKNPTRKFIIRPHSRSSGLYNEIGLSSNIKVFTGPEKDLLKYNKFIYTFPSSSMLAPALLGKNIYSAYYQHYCKEARDFHTKYADTIPMLGKESEKNYNKFIEDHLVYSEEQSTVDRILEMVK